MKSRLATTGQRTHPDGRWGYSVLASTTGRCEPFFTNYVSVRCEDVNRVRQFPLVSGNFDIGELVTAQEAPVYQVASPPMNSYSCLVVF
jgi:hypothetical protein